MKTLISVISKTKHGKISWNFHSCCNSSGSFDFRYKTIDCLFGKHHQVNKGFYHKTLFFGSLETPLWFSFYSNNKKFVMINIRMHSFCANFLVCYIGMKTNIRKWYAILHDNKWFSRKLRKSSRLLLICDVINDYPIMLSRFG